MVNDREVVLDILAQRRAVDTRVGRIQEYLDSATLEELTGPTWFEQPFSESLVKLAETRPSRVATELRMISNEFVTLRERVAGEVMELTEIIRLTRWDSQIREHVKEREKYFKRALAIQSKAGREDAAFEKRAGVRVGWLGRK